MDLKALAKSVRKREHVKKAFDTAPPLFDGDASARKSSLKNRIRSVSRLLKKAVRCAVDDAEHHSARCYV